MMFSKKVILFDYGYFGVSILILKFQACVLFLHDCLIHYL